MVTGLAGCRLVISAMGIVQVMRRGRCGGRAPVPHTPVMLAEPAPRTAQREHQPRRRPRQMLIVRCCLAASRTTRSDRHMTVLRRLPIGGWSSGRSTSLPPNFALARTSATGRGAFTVRLSPARLRRAGLGSARAGPQPRDWSGCAGCRRSCHREAARPHRPARCRASGGVPPGHRLTSATRVSGAVDGRGRF
jgi:hypothetical protein